ncbi:MAG TPA: hypothetical protein VG474_06755 [Solirubrobacteraceae bacterium]|nr:hypothetical protein [Solirubrobacteraceae bacterium]
MTASDALRELERLTAERLDAIQAGLRQRDLHARIEQELSAARSAYIGLAVTEIATLRGELWGRPSG